MQDQNSNAVWRNDNTEPFGDSVPNGDPNNTGTSFDFPLRLSNYYADRETGTLYAMRRDCYDRCSDVSVRATRPACMLVPTRTSMFEATHLVSPTRSVWHRHLHHRDRLQTPDSQRPDRFAVDRPPCLSVPE